MGNKINLFKKYTAIFLLKLYFKSKKIINSMAPKTFLYSIKQ